MGTCQSKRDLLPKDSRHVMLGVKNEAELRRRYESYNQEEELPPGYDTYRPPSLDYKLGPMEEQGSGKRIINKRATMDPMEEQGSGKRIINKRATMDTLRSSITSSTTLVEPTPQGRRAVLPQPQGSSKPPGRSANRPRCRPQPPWSIPRPMFESQAA